MPQAQDGRPEAIRKYSHCHWHECYFPLHCREVQANRGYSTENKENVAPKVRYQSKEKYQKKAMVWVAISTTGISQFRGIQERHEW